MEEKYQICIETVMDTSDSSIRFDEEGRSNHYWEYHNFVKHNWHKGNEGRALLEQQLDRIRREGKGRDFDCIMGLSGGADSSYMLHKMVTEFGLRPLVFHVDGGWNSDVSVSNIKALVDALKVDLFTEVINWEEMRAFQLAMFKSGVPHLDIPQDMAFAAVLYKFAQQYGIKHILNGGNISTECVLMPVDILYWGTDTAHIRDILRKHGPVSLPTFPMSNVLYHKLYLRYMRGLKVVKPLNFMPYVKSEAMQEMEDTYGWKTYPQKHFESRFTRFFEGYWLPNRFGYDMRRNQFSSLILTGQMTRDEALVKLNSPPLSQDDEMKDFQYVTMKLGISSDELMNYFNMPKRYYWDYKNRKWFFDFGEKIMSLFAKTRRGGAF